MKKNNYIRNSRFNEFVGATISCLLLIICQGCSDNKPLKPESGGKPYEVLLVGDVDSMVWHTLNRHLSTLPQTEKQFDLSAVNYKQFNGITRLARNIVLIEVNKKKFSKPQITYAYCVYAQPQVIITIGVANKTMLKNSSSAIGKQVGEILNTAERNREIARLEKRHQVDAARSIKQMFGHTLYIPQEMTFCKQGVNFLWFSDNGTEVSRNICIYCLSNGDVSKRDSVLRQNIKGETDSMYLHILPSSLDVQELKDPNETLTKGLWEMKGDGMGGSFIERRQAEGKSILVVMAFVYAPSKKKRNYIKQLEAALYTLK